MPMRPCDYCLNNNWEFEKLDNGMVRATCQECANEVEFEYKKKKRYTKEDWKKIKKDWRKRMKEKRINSLNQGVLMKQDEGVNQRQTKSR